MKMSRRIAFPVAAVTVVGALTTFGAAGTASAAEPEAAGHGYGGYSDGTAVYVNALNVPGQTDLAKVYTANSAAGAAVGEKLHTQDALGNPLLTGGKKANGHNAYGHGSALNGSLGQAANAAPQIEQTTANAVSPPPKKVDNSKKVAIPDNPLLSAKLLPSKAEANTKSTDSLCVGPPISSGDGHIADAAVLPAGDAASGLPDPLGSLVSSDFALVNAPGEIDSKSAIGLGNSAKGASGSSLISQTVQSIAPIHLFQGVSLPGASGSSAPGAVPSGEIDIDVLTDIALEATAGGVAHSAGVKYGFVSKKTHEPVSGDTPVVRITAGGQTQELTAQQLAGSDGITINLVLADITIGAPPHAIGDPSAKPTKASDGTSASGAVDFIKITSPGSKPLGVASGGQLGQVTGPLGKLIDQINSSPVGDALSQLRDQLSKQAQILDLRVGHMESAVSVPQGGVVCPAANSGGSHETTPPPQAPKESSPTLAFTGWGGAAPLGALALVVAGLAAVAFRRRRI